MRLDLEEQGLMLRWAEQRGQERIYRLLAERFVHPNGYLPDQDINREISGREMDPIIHKLIENVDGLEYSDVY